MPAGDEWNSVFRRSKEVLVIPAKAGIQHLPAKAGRDELCIDVT